MSDNLIKYLRESEERYRALVETASDAILSIDENSTIIFANSAVETVFGYKVFELIGQPLSILIPESLSGGYLENISRFLKSGQQIAARARMEINAKRQDGTIFPLEFSFAESTQNGSRCFIGIARDISSRKRTEQVLLENQRMLTLAMQSSSIGAWEIDIDSGIVFWSEELETIFGLEIGSFPQTRDAFYDLVHENDRQRMQAEIQKSIADHREFTVEFRFYHADGSVRWMEGRGQAVYSDEAKPVRVYGIGMDITERKKAAEISDRYKLLSKQARDIILFIRPDGSIVDANQAALEAYGYDHETLLQMNLRQLRAPETIQILGEQLIQANEQGIQFETLHRRKDGTIFPVEVNSMGSDIGGERLLVSIVRDISERRRVDTAMRESEERFRNMADNAPVMVWVTEKDGNCTYLSKSWFKFTGQTPEEGLGFGWTKALHPNDRERARLSFIKSNENQEPFYSEYRIRRADGVYRWAIDSANPRFSDGGEYLGYIGSVLDITERKEAEEALRQSQERLNLILDSSKLGLWYCDLPFDVLNWSEKTKEHFWLPPDATVTIDVFYARIHPEDRERTELSIKESIDNRTGYDIEYRTVEPESGDVKWIRAIGRAFYDEANNPYRFDGITIDITRDKLAENEREELLHREQIARQEAEAANVAKDEFLSVLSHELRTPLNAILGWLRLLKTGSLDEARNQQAIDTIERNARLQNNLIEDLLDVSRIISGKMRIESERTEFVSVINSALETVRPLADSKNISLDFQTDIESVEIMGDANRLQQIIVNLANNAVKFTSPGGKVRSRLQKNDGKARFEITDSGIGISKDFLPFIFDRFRQADSTTQRHHSGLGLGLTIVRHLTELHGGEVFADSDGEGKGSSFAVEIPLPFDGNNFYGNFESGRFAPENARFDNVLHGKTLLLVDDDCDGIFPVKLFLENHGAEIICVESGSEALEKIGETNFDLILSDIGMPQMDGYEFIRKVRSMNEESSPPAIALTAYASAEDRARALDAGFQMHLSKPIDFERLLRAITAIIDR
jgi:PAS domain S-box-containing protein